MDKRQHGCTDQTAATQPYTKQALIHCVFWHLTSASVNFSAICALLLDQSTWALPHCPCVLTSLGCILEPVARGSGSSSGFELFIGRWDSSPSNTKLFGPLSKSLNPSFSRGVEWPCARTPTSSAGVFHWPVMYNWQNKGSFVPLFVGYCLPGKGPAALSQSSHHHNLPLSLRCLPISPVSYTLTSGPAV